MRKDCSATRVPVIHDVIIDAAGWLKLLVSLYCMDHAGFVSD